jgi:hypothetical protein
MNRFVVASVSITGLLLGAGCVSTELETSWRAPDVGEIEFDKIMVMAVAPDGALRRTAEEAMQREIERVPTVAAYELLQNEEDLKDRMRVAEAVREAGVDGLIVLRFIRDDTEVIYRPGNRMPPPYTSFWGYYTRPYALAPFYWDYRDQPEVVSSRVVGIETNIYNARDESLIWSGYTRTRDPANIEQLVAEVADVVRDHLREQGLIR